MRNAMDSEEAHGSHKPRPLRVDVDLVLLPVTVSDPMNHEVTSLKKEDFAIYEGNQQQEIRYFSTEDAPISVAILLDVSKSMSDKIDTERAALVEFFNNANPNDEYFAIAFSDRPRVLADSTQSIGAEEKPVDQRIVGKIPRMRMRGIDAAECGEKLPAFQLQVEWKICRLQERFFDFDL